VRYQGVDHRRIGEQHAGKESDDGASNPRVKFIAAGYSAGEADYGAKTGAS
jgi:hypothetical protein